MFVDDGYGDVLALSQGVEGLQVALSIHLTLIDSVLQHQQDSEHLQSVFSM